MAAACGLAMAVTLPATVAFAQDVTLRMGHIHAPSGPTGRGADMFAELASEYTEGRVEVQVFPSSQLGGLRDLFGASRSGAVDIALTPYPLLSDIVPSYSILTAGYVFDDFSHQLAVLDHPDYGQAWSAELGENGGLIVLGNYYFGARTLTTTNTEIRTPRRSGRAENPRGGQPFVAGDDFRPRREPDAAAVVGAVSRLEPGDCGRAGKPAAYNLQPEFL